MGFGGSDFKKTTFIIGNDNFQDLIIKETAKQDNCYITNKDDQLICYNDFVLYNGAKVKFICNITFFPSTDNQKYLPRLTFKKIKLTGEEKETASNKIIIEFNDTDKANKLRSLLSFLSEYKDLVDTGNFNKKFRVVDSNISFILDQISNIENSGIVLNALNKMKIEDLENLENLVSINRLQNICKKIEENLSNDQEIQFWQPLFQQENWILSQIFATPFIFIEKEFFCGGKRGSNKGGISTDFLYKNSLTKNIAFIEIKTPLSFLTGSKLYRGVDSSDNNAIYGISPELTGAVNQLLNQRNSFILKKDSLEEVDKNIFNTKCILISGKVSDLNDGQKKSFELYRRNLSDVEIITYDELLLKIKMLLNILVPKVEDMQDLPF